MRSLKEDLQEQEDWGTIYVRHESETRAYFAAHLGNCHDVDDLVQDVFTALVTRHHLPRDVPSYIHTVARNRLRRYWREKTRSRWPALSETTHDVVTAVGSFPVDRASDPFERLASRETGILVRRILSQLPSEAATAFRLRFAEGLSLGQVAARVGCSQDALRMRLQRARGRVRRILTEATKP